MIIATTKFPNCLVAYLATCQEPLKSLLHVETGYNDRLVIDDAAWEIIPEDQRWLIQAYADGFIEGWEAKEDWKDYE